MKTNLSLKDELLSAIRRIVAKFWAQEVGQLMRLQSVGYHAKLRTKIGIRSRIASRMLLSTLLMLTICIGNVWGAKITDYKNIVSGTEYYIGATTSFTDYYWCSPQTTTGNGLSGTAVTSKASATIVILEGSGTSWKIKIKGTSNYVTLADSKANGKFNIAASSSNWTFSNASSLIKMLYTGSYCLQKNNSGTQFGSYANTQTNVWLEVAAATPSITPDPTSLSWGTVLQGSSQSTKTISITGTNLTAGTLTISATGGYSVTPTSKSVGGTLAATTLTVTPPSTSTTGAKNGKVTISGGGLASNVEVNLTMTVQASHTVTWMVNGSEHATTQVADGSKPEFPSNPSSCDGTSTTFVGWTPTPWSGKLDDVSAKTIYTSGAAMPNVSADVTYYAVFAKVTANTYKKGTKDDLLDGQTVLIVNPSNSYAMSSDAGSSSGRLAAVSVIISENKFTKNDATLLWTVETSSTNYKFKQGTKYLWANNSNNQLYANSSYEDAWSVTAQSGHYVIHNVDVNKDLQYYSSNFSTYNTGTNEAYQMDFYIPDCSQYLTNCCTSLGSINGSVKSISGTGITLLWDDISNVSSWAVSGIDVTNSNTAVPSGNIGTPTDKGSTYECAISSLTAGHQYKFTISATASSGYCDKTQEITVTTPLITLSETGLSGMSYIEGFGPSTQTKTFTVTAVGLTGNLTVSSPTNFQVSTDNSSWGSSKTISHSSGSASGTVYVRLASGLSEGSYGSASTYVTVSGGSATTKNVSVQGSVSPACAAPTINTQPAASASYNMNVTATALTVVATKNGTGPALTYQWYSNTANSKTTPTPTLISGAMSSSYTPTTSAVGTKYYFCEVSSGACTETTNISAITVNTPTITVSETARAFGDRKVSGGPYEMTFTVSGSNLAKDQGIGLAITGTNAGMFAIKNNVTSITQTTAGAVAETTVTVQYSPTGAGSHSATLTLSSTSATSKAVALTGTGKWEVTWNVNGGATTSLVANGTKPTLPSPAPSSCDLTSTTFIGWATSSWSGKLDDVSDKTIHADNSTMSNITANGTTFYAVFAKAGGAPITWDKVASMNSLSVGDVFVFASGTNAVTDPENTTNPPKGTSITVNGSNQITSTVTDAMKWTFAKDGDNYTFYPNGDDEKWLRCNTTASSSSNNNMRVDAISGRTKFAIDNSGYLVTNDTYTDRYFSYYSDGNDFRGYTGTSNGAFVPICYKRNGGTTYSEYITSCCDLKAVTGLTVSGVTGNSVTLTWTAPSPTTGIDHLELRNASTDAKIGNDIAVGTTSATVSGLTECTTYTYKVVSVGATCETPSETVEGTPYSGAKTITYKYHDDVTADGSFTTDCTHSSTTLPNPSRTGYTLNGWYTAASGGPKIGNGGASYEPSADITLHAQWSLTNYTVTMAQTPAISATLTGGTTTANYGNTINISTNVPSGYRFNGWTSSPSVTFANASAASTGFTMPASNVTVTANFVQVHSVSFSVPSGGGTVVSPPSTVDHGGTLTFPNVTDVDCGTFLGWTTAANSSYSSTSGTPTPLYAAAATTTINAAAVFYAVYSKVGDNPVAATLYAHSGGTNTITNAGYTNVTVTTSGLGTYSDASYAVKFEGTSCYAIFQLDGTPTSFSAALKTLDNGASGTSTMTLYESDSPSGPWTEIKSVDCSAHSTTYALSETTAANFSKRVLKMQLSAYGRNIKCGDITINGLRAPITYTTNPSCVDWRLQSIAVTTAPTKTTYDECEEFDPTGMVVTATMYEYGNESNTTTKDVGGYTWSPTSLVTPGNSVAVTISYTEKDVTRTTTTNVRVNDLDNYTITFHDGGNTTTWTQSNHCAACNLDSRTGSLACGDYTFAGWSTSSTSYDDASATITTWVSGSYTPTANTHLYAVYRKGAAPAEFTANCAGGTFTIFEANGNTHMAGRVNATPRLYTTEYWNDDCLSCEEDDGTPFTFTKIADNTYKIQNSEGDYLRKYSSGNHPDFENTWHDEDNFKWIISSGTNGTWRFTNKAANTYALVKTGSYFDFQLASNVTLGSSYYDLELSPVASTVYQSNPSCSGTYTITFNTHGGTFVQGDYEYSTETTDGLSETTNSYFPSATMPGCTFVGWKEGSAQEDVTSGLPVGLFEGGDVLLVSSNKTYHAVYYYLDDDWEFDPVEGGTYHMYATVSETKYFCSGTPGTSYGTLSATTNCVEAVDVTITPGTEGNTGKYTINIGGYDITPELKGTGIKRGTFWWNINEVSENLYHITADGAESGRSFNFYKTSSAFTHYKDNGAGNTLDISFGRCRQNHWTSDPVLRPIITLGSTGSLNVTSTNGKTVYAANKLTIEATRYGEQTKLYLFSNNANIGLRKGDGTALDVDGVGPYIQTDASGELATTNITITYTPNVSTDGIETATITVRDNTSPSVQASATRVIKARHLPTDFVIAAKNTSDNKWYALPANMDGTGNPVPVEIAVDDNNNPSIAYTATSNIYNLYSKGTSQYVQLGMKNNVDGSSRSYALWANNSSGSNDIGKYTGLAQSDLGDNYQWLLTQTNGSISTPQEAKYTISNPNNANALKAWFTAGGGPKWGLYANGVAELRLIPASSIVFTEAEVVEWGQHGGVIEVDAQGINATSVVAHLGEANSSAVELSQTGTSVKGSATKYDYTVNFGNDINFADASSNGAMLTLEWKNGETVKAMSNIIVPKIVATSATMSSLIATDDPWNTADVHVLPGVTLTANAGDFSSKDVVVDRLEIYPGATVTVTKGAQDVGTLKVRTLVLRNGWTRIGEKAYDVARLYVSSDANLAKNAIENVWYADWYIDYDQYYPIAVPWNVTVANMSYLNSNNAASAGVKLRYYDGASRASNVQSGVGESANWKEYGATGNLSIPATLTPGVGYAMTAKRPTGKAFSIIRMPLTIPSAAWTRGGEQGSVTVDDVTTHKDQVSVTAHGDDNTPTYAKGWNLIANPYMSLYNGTLSYGENNTIEYANIPDINFQEYSQVPINSTTKLKPSSAFLVQAPITGTATFATGSRVAAAPSYRNAGTATTPTQKAYIVLADEQTEDMMGILVSEKYTADYELNADLEKLLSDGNTLRTYMRYNDMNMAYLAINEELAKQLIPVSVRIPADGEYTFRIHEASIADELEGIYLTDYQANIVTNLLYDSYTFNAVAGTDNVRFAINAVIGKREVPTGVDISDSNKDRPTKFIWNDKVYILHNNVIYDSTGKRVNVINK